MITNFLNKTKEQPIRKLNPDTIYSRLADYMYKIIDPEINQVSLRWGFNGFQGLCDLKNHDVNPLGFQEKDFDCWAPNTEYAQQIAKSLNLPDKGRVFLNKLSPGTCTEITSARDVCRAYIPLSDNKGAFLISDGKLTTFEAGVVRVIDVSNNYTIVNSDKEDLIYLVFHNCMYHYKW